VIRNLQTKTLSDFGGGRVTSENIATIPDSCLSVARNILISQGAPQKIAGYRSLQQLDILKTETLYDFQRQTDDAHYMIAAGSNGAKASVILAPIDGSAFVPIPLSTVEDSGRYDIIQNVHTAYLNNGFALKKIINVEGVETLVPVGLKPPIAAPGIEIGDGDLYLAFGRRYVYAEVFRWTDSLGDIRFHVSPPSDFSGHTGKCGTSVSDVDITTGTNIVHSPSAPFLVGDIGQRIRVIGAGPDGSDLLTTITGFTDTSHVTTLDNASTTVAAATCEFRLKAVTVSNMFARNPHTTHFWIYSVEDSAIDSSDFYAFAGEIPVAYNSWVDQLADDERDLSREASWDNTPPPQTAQVMAQFNDRMVLVDGDKVYFSAFDEISQGQAIECFPSSLTFRIPGGVLDVTAMKLFKIGEDTILLLSTLDYWFKVSGSSLDSFTKRDKVLTPGTVGQRCVLEIHGRLVYLAPDKKLRAWTGITGDEVLPASIAIDPSTSDTQLSMNELDESLLSEGELLWYSNGTYDFAVFCVSSNNSESGEKDWVQMWDLTPIVGVKTIQGPVPNPSMTDFFPTDKFSTAMTAKDGGIGYVYFGDQEDGTIYRWPDGDTFNGDIIDALFATPWMKIAPGKLRYRWLKFLTDVPDAKDKFRAFVQVGNGTSAIVSPYEVTLEAAPDDDNPDGTVMKAPIDLSGQWIKVFVKMPENEAGSVSAIELAYTPIGRV
jgi:hypothetical protein